MVKMNFKLTLPQLLKICAYIVLIVFVGTLITISLFPIYPDEIAIRYTLSRIVEDYPFKSTAIPVCMSTMLKKFEWFEFFPASINWLLHGTISSPLALRILGVFIAILEFLMIIKLFINTKTSSSGTKGNFSNLVICLGLIFSILGLGNFPIFLVLNRNEQLIIIALLGLLFLYNSLIDGEKWQGRIFGYTLIYFGLLEILLYSHPKSLFLIPVVTLVGIEIFLKIDNKLAKTTFLILFLLIIYSFYNYWKNAYSCPDNTSIDILNKSYSLDLGLLYTNPIKFFEMSILSFINNFKYVDHLIFSESYEVDYLPGEEISFLEQVTNNILIAYFFVIYFIEIVYFLYFYTRKSTISNKKYSSRNLILVILFISINIGAIFNLPKHWYDADYFYYILAIILIQLIAQSSPKLFESKIYVSIIIALFALSITSQGLFIKRNLTAFFSGFEGPGLSLTKFYRDNPRNSIKRLQESCGLNSKNNKFIFVDDLTYWSLKDTKWPFPITYLWIDANKEGLNSLFAKLQPDGVLVRCSSLLYNLGSPIIKDDNGEICCISKENLKP